MKHNYGIMFLMIAATQLLICNYLNISAYVTISLLPVLFLCFPTRFSTTFSPRAQSGSMSLPSCL